MGFHGTEKLSLLEDIFENCGNYGGTGCITEELNKLDIGNAELGELNRFSADHGESVSDRFDDFFHFIAFQVADKVLLIEEVVDSDTSLSVGSQNLSGLLNSFHNAQFTSDVLHRIVSVLFVEFSSTFFHNSVIKVSSTEVSIRVVSNNSDLIRSELSDSDGSLGAT